MAGRWKWLGLVFLVAGPVLTWEGWQARSLWQRLETVGKTTAGVLESGEVQRGRRGSRRYRFEVRYTPEGRDPILRTFDVSKDFAERMTRDDTIVNDECVVRYDPADPNVAILEGGSKDERGLFPVGLGVCGIGVVAGLLLLRRRKPPLPESAPLT